MKCEINDDEKYLHQKLTLIVNTKNFFFFQTHKNTFSKEYIILFYFLIFLTKSYETNMDFGG